jgi:hypothetical protein
VSAWSSVDSAWRAALTAGLTVVGGVVIATGGAVGTVFGGAGAASPTTRATERTAAGTGTPTA